MRWCLVPTVLFALVGCKTEIITQYPRPDVGQADTGADTSDVGGDVDGSGDATPVDPQWVGAACEVDGDCTPGTCLTRATLDNFGVGPEIDVPGGMCSSLLCQNDDACGPNGLCFDASFLGAPVSLCMARCNDIADCRWEEGWDCFPLDEVDPEASAEDGGVCVSDSIQVAIVCDDGHCEEGAQ